MMTPKGTPREWVDRLLLVGPSNWVPPIPTLVPLAVAPGIDWCKEYGALLEHHTLETDVLLAVIRELVRRLDSSAVPINADEWADVDPGRETPVEPVQAPVFRPVMTVWVVYFSPRDYPGKYVLRGQDVVDGQSEPVPQTGCIVRDNLEDVRRPLIERGLYRMPRHPEDEPAIVETWM